MLNILRRKTPYLQTKVFDKFLILNGKHDSFNFLSASVHLELYSQWNIFSKDSLPFWNHSIFFGLKEL